MERIYVAKMSRGSREPEYVIYWEGQFQRPICILSDYRLKELKDEIKKAELTEIE